MALVREGDRVAFAHLVERHRHRAWAVAWRYTGSTEAAQDLVQDAFLRVWENAGRYRGEGRFVGYLLRLLVNRALNLKRASVREVTAEAPEPSGGESPEDRLERARHRQAVVDAMQALPPSQRMALALRYQDDMSYEEIAAAMECSVKAVERLIARGRDGLRGRLAYLSTST